MYDVDEYLRSRFKAELICWCLYVLVLEVALAYSIIFGF